MTDRSLHLIQSADNPLYRQLRKLCQSSRERRKAGQVVLDGMHLIQAYEAQWGPVAQLWVREGDRERGEIGAFLTAHPERCPLFLADKLMDIEWGKDGVDGKLYILQARPETVKSQEGHERLQKFKLKSFSKVLASGRAIGQKIGTGPVRIVMPAKSNFP